MSPTEEAFKDRAMELIEPQLASTTRTNFIERFGKHLHPLNPIPSIKIEASLSPLDSYVGIKHTWLAICLPQPKRSGVVPTQRAKIPFLSRVRIVV